MNRDPFAHLGRPAVNEEGSLPAPAERLRQLVLTNRPEVREAQAKVTMAKAKLELARREWIPDPTVSLEAERYNAASQFVSQVGGGGSISVPWLNGKKYRAEEREAQGELSAAESDFVSTQTESLGFSAQSLWAALQKTAWIIGTSLSIPISRPRMRFVAAEPAGEDRNS